MVFPTPCRHTSMGARGARHREYHCRGETGNARHANTCRLTILPLLIQRFHVKAPQCPSAPATPRFSAVLEVSSARRALRAAELVMEVVVNGPLSDGWQ